MKKETVILASFLFAMSLDKVMGERWTDEEIEKVTAKLKHTFSHGFRPARDFKNVYKNGVDGYEIHGDLYPSAPKFVRLGFHDCIPYQDGAANGFANGCDGCLNNHNMGINMVKKYHDPKGSWNAPVPMETDNNGLWMTADYLELIYTRRDFPPRTPKLSKSLKDAGRSRADLWAFASAMAMEFSMDASNRACDGPIGTWLECGNVRMNDPDCKFDIPRRINFKFGRKDCEANDQSSIRPFFTSRKEVHPLIHATGEQTVKFYQDNFGFSPNEAIALHGGAHSMGQMHDSISTLKYEWIKRQRNLLNNQFFRMLDEQPTYSMGKCDNKNTLHPAALVGDQFGNPGKRSWMVINSRRNRTVGGAYQFFLSSTHCESGECGNIYKLPPFKSSCCQGLEEGRRCKDECVKYRDNDMEAALLADVGLVYDFDVDPVSGAPTGCPGLDWKHALEWKKHDPQCPKGKYAGIVKMFADDQDKWVSEFLVAAEKMLSNGYSANQLE